MAFYATLLLARVPDRLLVELPEVKKAFGSKYGWLEDRGDGWQLLSVNPHYHEWPHVGAGPEELVAATGAPVLAAWVSESMCAQLVAMTPGGQSWSRHFLANDGLARGACGYDHWQFAALRLAQGEQPGDADVADPGAALLAWAGEAGLVPSPKAVDWVLTSVELNGRDRILALVDALGAPEVREIPRLFGQRELDWWDTWDHGNEAGMRLCRRWTSKRPGVRDDARERPWDADHLEFLDRVAASVFGTGLSRAEVVALSERLRTRWAATIAEQST